MNRVLTVIVNNRMGVLNRITGLFLRRGANIQSIAVGATETEGLSRMTIALNVDSPAVVEQVMKQLHKQIDVLKVSDISDQPMIARELVLIRVNVSVANRAEVTGLVAPFRATVVDVGRESLTIQATGKSEKVDALVALLRPYGIKELSRTGITALTRDSDTVNEVAKLNKSNLVVL